MSYFDKKLSLLIGLEDGATFGLRKVMPWPDVELNIACEASTKLHRLAQWLGHPKCIPSIRIKGCVNFLTINHAANFGRFVLVNISFPSYQL
jgi:hypothetical protein